MPWCEFAQDRNAWQVEFGSMRSAPGGQAGATSHEVAQSLAADPRIYVVIKVA